MSGAPYQAGGFWWFAEPGTPGKVLSIHELLAQGVEDSRAVLVGAGFNSDELVNDLAGVRARTERGSQAEVALGVLVAALRCMPLLDRAKPSAKSFLRQATYDSDIDSLAARTEDRWGGMVDAAAIAVASFAMRYAILISMAGGLTESAQVGKKALAQRVAAAKASAAVSRNQEWRADAVAFWNTSPTWSLNKVAGTIAAKRTTSNRLVDKRSVIRAIRDLIPETSPSYKRG